METTQERTLEGTTRWVDCYALATPDFRLFVRSFERADGRVLMSESPPESAGYEHSGRTKTQIESELYAIRNWSATPCGHCGAPRRGLVWQSYERANEADVLPAQDLVIARIQRFVTKKAIVGPG